MAKGKKTKVRLKDVLQRESYLDNDIGSKWNLVPKDDEPQRFDPEYVRREREKEQRLSKIKSTFSLEPQSDNPFAPSETDHIKDAFGRTRSFHRPEREAPRKDEFSWRKQYGHENEEQMLDTEKHWAVRNNKGEFIAGNLDKKAAERMRDNLAYRYGKMKISYEPT